MPDQLTKDIEDRSLPGKRSIQTTHPHPCIVYVYIYTLVYSLQNKPQQTCDFFFLKIVQLQLSLELSVSTKHQNHPAFSVVHDDMQVFLRLKSLKRPGVPFPDLVKSRVSRGSRNETGPKSIPISFFTQKCINAYK